MTHEKRVPGWDVMWWALRADIDGKDFWQKLHNISSDSDSAFGGFFCGDGVISRSESASDNWLEGTFDDSFFRPGVLPGEGLSFTGVISRLTLAQDGP